MKRVLALGAVLLALAGVAALVTLLSIPLYPGAMKWTASSLCPADQPDPFVVRTEHTDSEGTSYNFSLFCMGERGDYEEVGVAAPAGRLFLWIYGGLVATVLALILVLRWRRARDREQVIPR